MNTDNFDYCLSFAFESKWINFKFILFCSEGEILQLSHLTSTSYEDHLMDYDQKPIIPEDKFEYQSTSCEIKPLKKVPKKLDLFIKKQYSEKDLLLNLKTCCTSANRGKTINSSSITPATLKKHFTWDLTLNLYEIAAAITFNIEEVRLILNIRHLQQPVAMIFIFFSCFQFIHTKLFINSILCEVNKTQENFQNFTL